MKMYDQLIKNLQDYGTGALPQLAREDALIAAELLRTAEEDAMTAFAAALAQVRSSDLAKPD